MAEDRESGIGFYDKKEYEYEKSFIKDYSFSHNKNPYAVRRGYGRQTYSDRSYPGKAGNYLPEEQILVRFNIENAFDEDFLDNLLTQVERIKEKSDGFDIECLNYGADVCLESLRKFTPIDTGYLVSRWQVFPDYNNHSIRMENDCEYMEAQNYGKDGTRNGKDKHGNVLYAWYPGYYMMERAEHETMIKMNAYQREKNRQLKREVESGN